MKTKNLWEILVPCSVKTKPVRKKHHQQWDKVVRSISGGLTIFNPIKGQWHHTDTGELICERMIPVRFYATENQMKKVANFTLSHYHQHTALVYLVSEKVFFITAK